MKICSKCGVDDSQKPFRKNRCQCQDCFNNVRRAGNKKKIGREQAILAEIGRPVPDRYKQNYKAQYYLDHKDEISEQSKLNYIDKREDRLKRAKHNYYNNFTSSLIRSLKQRAKNMNLEFDLDKNFIDDLFVKQNNKCLLTGIIFILDKNDSSRRPFAPSIDRIDSKLGYTKNNVRLVCVIVNLALNEFGDQTFDKMCRSYVENTLRSSQ